MEKKVETPVCAIYVRYSGEDELEDKKGTKSLRNQKESLLEYAKEHEISVYSIYEDYFISGTTMDRPGINQLFKDMKEGLFNVILVKDLSRFSRNYIDAGHYFEEVFPLYNIRFISVSDNYDSLYEDELLPIKNYFNTMYVKDIQKKIDVQDKSITSEKKKSRYLILDKNENATEMMIPINAKNPSAELIILFSSLLSPLTSAHNSIIAFGTPAVQSKKKNV